MHFPGLGRLTARRITTPTNAVIAFRDAIHPSNPSALYALWLDEQMNLITGTHYPLGTAPAKLVADARRLASQACILGRPHEGDMTALSAFDIEHAQECRLALGGSDVRIVDYIVVAPNVVYSLALRGSL